MKVRIWACTDKMGSKVERTIEVDDDDLEDTTLEAYMDEVLQDEVWNLIECGYEKVE